MAFGTPVAAAAAYSASGGTTVSPAYPAGILATDEVLLFVGQKPSTANGGTVTTPAGWTLRDELTAAGGYGATLGNDTGNTNLRVYSWNTPVAGQTGNLTVTVGTNGVCWAFMVRIPTGDGNVSFGAADGQQTTTPTSPLSVALTNGATATAFEAGDLAIWAMCVPTDAGGGTTFSAHTISATGATFGATTELNEPSSGTGQDIGGVSVWANVTAGSSTAAPTIGATLTGTLTNIRGPVVLLRIRETTQFLTQDTTFTNTPAFFGPTAQATNSVTPALFTNTPQFYSPTVSLAVDQTLTQNTRFTNTPQFFAATSTSPVTLSQVAFGPANLLSWSEQLDIASGWSLGTAVTVTTDTVVAPDGTTTADTITYTGGNGTRFVRKFISGRPLQYYTYSIYVKKNNYRYVGIRPCSLGPGLGTGQEHCVFDFDTETFVYTPPTSGIISTGFTNVGNGWYRIYATSQFSINSSFTGRVASVAITDSLGFEQGGTLPATGSEVYAWGAQLELSTAVSGYIKTTSTAPVQQQVPNVFFAPTVTQTGATQNLTPALYTNTPQFFSATATATNTLTPALYTNTPQFFAATATASNTLTPALYTNTPAFFAATVTQTNNVLVYWLEVEQVAAQNLSPALYTNTPQFFAATVTAGAVDLSPALYTNTPQFFGPTVTAGAVNLSPALYTNTPQFFGAAITQDGSLAQITRFTNTPQFFAATITVGPVTLTQNTRFTNTPQFFTAAITSVLTQNTRYTNTQQFFAPTATATRNLTPALYTNTPQFFAATLTATRTLTPALYTNTPQFFTHTVTPGAVALTQNTRYTNTPQFFGGTVVVGQSLVQATRFTNTPAFFAASLTNVNALTPALYTNTPAFFAATLAATNPLVQATRFTNTPQFFGGVVQQGQFLTFEDYVVAGYVDPPGYVEYIAYFNNVFFTGNLELQIAVSGLQSDTFVGTVDQTLASVVVPTGSVINTGIGYVNIWGLVDDTQFAGWQNIDVAQDPDWVPIDSCTC